MGRGRLDYFLAIAESCRGRLARVAESRAEGHRFARLTEAAAVR
jgi:hypothetical protein